jgi:uncharacterized delta-60 repeat protein
MQVGVVSEQISDFSRIRKRRGKTVLGEVAIMNRPHRARLIWGLAFLLFFLNVTEIMAAGDRLWVKRYGYMYAGPDYARGMVIDKNDNVIVVGQSLGNASTYFDFAVVKYNAAGNQLWTRRYSGPGGYDEPFAIAVDRQGNIVVTGKSFGTRGVGLPDILTVKYDAAGKFLWAKRYCGGDPATAAHEEGRAVATDGAGNVYVAGIVSSKSNTYYDAVLIKYGPAGDRKWVRTYDAPFYDNDGYFAVAVDAAGNVFATGYSTQSGLRYQDIITVKYNPAGTRQWLRFYNGEDSIEDWAESIAIDRQGNAVVAGSTGRVCDTSAEVCYSYVTIKYSPAGVRSWVATYYPLPVSDNLAHAVKVDNGGNVLITGQSAHKSAFYDVATVKYSPAGKQLWVQRYDGPGRGNDMAYGLAVDSKGNVIIAGQSYVNLDAMVDALTVKYSANGNPVWVRRYNGPGADTDMAFFVGVDSKDNVYSSGFSVGDSTTAEDVVTIKYAP